MMDVIAVEVPENVATGFPSYWKSANASLNETTSSR